MSKLVLVTGASGYLASHVVYQLLQGGFRVRATARGKKVAALKELYRPYPSIEVFDVPDLAESQFEAAFAGVDIVMHTAAPLPARVDLETMFASAVEGSLNVLRQAEKAGVRKFVVTSSIVANLNDPTTQGVSLRSDHWNPLKKEDVGDDPILAYCVAKTYSERAVWEWAEAHPHVDVTTINPTYLYGPTAPISLRLAPGDFTSMATMLFVYNLFTKPGQHLPGFGSVDVRDTARAHIGVVLAPPSAAPRKRVISAPPHGLVESELFDLIREKRPEVGKRLIGGENVKYEFDRYDIDFKEVEEWTGMKKEDFHTTEQTFLDTIDSLLAIEKDWKEHGFIPSEVPLMQG